MGPGPGNVLGSWAILGCVIILGGRFGRELVIMLGTGPPGIGFIELLGIEFGAGPGNGPWGPCCVTCGPCCWLVCGVI